MREFNTTGTCIREENYMVDISGKLEQITALIDRGKYFTINRGRQYGKTTTFSMLEKTLQGRYTVIRLNFEGVDYENFSTGEDFVRMFVDLAARELERRDVEKNIVEEWRGTSERIGKDGKAFDCLSRGITELCGVLPSPVLLMIDEVDQSSDNQVFLNFLGMLRNKYLEARDGRDTTFRSVILAGVYDIKNLKLKIRPDAEKKYNSPWNIAVDFDVDMSFSAEEIATMLADYERDNAAGMNIEEVSAKLRFYTSGYPFLVSWLCKWIDEKGGGRFAAETVDMAVREILKTTNTLFDDMVKKLYDNPDLSKLIEELLFSGREYIFQLSDPAVGLGSTFCILKNDDGKVAVSNIIFETFLYNHFASVRTRERNIFLYEKSQFLNDDGSLNMPQILRKFQEIMYSEYRERDEGFYERQGGLLFLCFLKPIINGVGNYYVEPETRMGGRMDIVVFYGRREYIVELKIWRGEQYREKGLSQLADYLDARNAEKGYLVSFDFRKNRKQTEGEVRLSSGKSGREYLVFEVVV